MAVSLAVALHVIAASPEAVDERWMDWDASASLETVYTFPNRRNSRAASYLLGAEVGSRPLSMRRTSLQLSMDHYFWFDEDDRSTRAFLRDPQLRVSVPELTDQSEAWVRSHIFLRARLPFSLLSEAYQRVLGVDIGGGVGRRFEALGPGDLDVRLDLSLRRNFGPVTPESFNSANSSCVMLGSWIEDRLIDCAGSEWQILGALGLEYSVERVVGVAYELGVVRRYMTSFQFDPEPPRGQPMTSAPTSHTTSSWYSSLLILIAPGARISGTIGVTWLPPLFVNRDGTSESSFFYSIPPGSVHGRVIFTL